MKRTLVTLAVLVLGIASAGSSGDAESLKPKPGSPRGDFVVIGWNSLGMHCINPSFKDLAILPPYNNLFVQVVRRGSPPEIVTSGVSLEYSIPNNTRVKGKTDFWQYARQLFGVDLVEGVGLTGNGLSGKMTRVGDHFEATGIPVLPLDDDMSWNPYQVATVRLKLASGGYPARTSVVLPVSDELNCAQCHAQGMDATVNIGGGVESVDLNILTVHDYYHGTNGVASRGAANLMDSRPVLCASCHSDNALGTGGDGTSKPLSQAMHGWHAAFPDAGCYSCHPGSVTQCQRTAISGMGYLGETPSCQTGQCHGGIGGVAGSIALGRQPWLQEPTCAQCHGVNFSTGSDLYRSSKGHGGLYCAACHNSPHAWWPSKLWADNLQPTKLQHSARSIGDCSVCHTDNLDGTNPHVAYLGPNAEP